MECDSFDGIHLYDGCTRQPLSPEDGLRGNMGEIRMQALQFYPAMEDPRQLILVRAGSRMLLQSDSFWFQNDTCLLVFCSEQDFEAYCAKKISSPTPNSLWLACFRLNVGRIRALLADSTTRVEDIPHKPTSAWATRPIRCQWTPLMVVLRQWKQNPLQAACIVDDLVSAGASFTETRDQRGWSALHFAATYADSQSLRLGERVIKEWAPRNHAGTTPLEMLCGRADAGPAMVEAFCRHLTTMDHVYEALMTACRHSSVQAVRLLLAAAGARSKGFWITGQLFSAAVQNQTGDAEAILVQFQRYRYCPSLPKSLKHWHPSLAQASLIARYAPRCHQQGTLSHHLVDLPDGTCFLTHLIASRITGWDPNESPFLRGSSELLQALLQMGARVDEQTKNKRTRATIERDRRIRINPEGDTVLHAAARAGDMQRVQECCASYANPYVANYRGEFPIQLVQQQQPDVRAALWNHMNRHLSESWDVVRWYGHGFEALVDAWVSVQQKRQRLGMVFLPCDMAYLVMEHVARLLFPFERLFSD